MTLASALYGSGGAEKYRAGNLYLAIPTPIEAASCSTGTDYIVPFIPRANMTLDRVAWYRDAGTAANVYVGLYSSAGVLLTDCAVDTNTTTGWHLVDTTDVALTANEFYWLCLNCSVDVVGVTSAYSANAAASIRPTYEAMIERYGIAIGIGIADTDLRGVAQAKTRANAALLSTLTMSGFNLNQCGTPPILGVIPA
jgi:hypothetical protein